MKKYLISIEDENSPRLNTFFTQATFKAHQQEFIKFGVVGANLSATEYFKLAVAGKQRALSPAELGCTLSHISAIKDFLKSNQEYACIFEDDAESLENLNLDELELDVQKLNLKKGFFLTLGGIQLSLNSQVRGRFLENQLYSKQVLEIHPYYYDKLSYAYAYVIDRTMAEYLLIYHRQPQLYDHWNKFPLYDLQPYFYACYLFDHPDIDQCSIKNSYLTDERSTLTEIKSNKVNRLDRFKNSILKRFYKMILNLYSVK